MPSSLFIPPLSIRHASARARKKIFSFFLANLVNSPCVSPNPGRDAHFELDRLVLAKAAWSQCPRHALPSIFSLRLSVPSAAKNIFQWSRLGAQLARRTLQIGVGPKIKASANELHSIESRCLFLRSIIVTRDVNKGRIADAFLFMGQDSYTWHRRAKNNLRRIVSVRTLWFSGPITDVNDTVQRCTQ